ncbi:PTS sugar transporter subunit IIC [Pediococcus acidilactici]|uniref:PTS sugar transporter subunit IIC n=1 Tax=Pediococcus acidilactici TaxID=1254 RepID=UPI000B3615B2|nr:PTS sugar transporter subunit IIC [Pediococcus acidilactici]
MTSIMAFNFSSFVIFVKINTPRIKVFHFNSGGTPHGLGFYLGSAVIKTFVNGIPAFVNNGFNYAMGIIPAIGFALLVRMIMTKKTAVFLLFGFLLAAYLKISILGVTAFGCVVAIILLVNTNSNGSHEVESEEDANEF